VTQTEQVQVTDGMIIEWDVPIDMDDGVQLQDLYIDHDGLIARHDYAPEILGGTQAAHYLSGYEEFDGSLFPTHRKVLAPLVKASPPDRRYENALAIADGDYVTLHGRLSTTGPQANRIAVDIVRLEDGLIAEHWDVAQDEATAESPRAGCPCSATRSPHGPDPEADPR